MTRDYLASFVAEGLAVIAALLTYRLAAAQWGTEGFAEYALSRKILSALLVIALVGMEIALVRAVAMAGPAHASAIGASLRGALLIVGVSALTVALVLVLASDPLSAVFYGGTEHAGLLPGLAFAVVGGAIQGLAYAFQRGRLRLVAAGALLVVNTGLVPLAAVIAARTSIATALVAMGLAWSAVGALVILPAMRRPAGPAPLQALLSYGAPRSVGFLVQTALLAAPPIVAAHRFGIEEAGNVAFALLALGVLSTLLTPIGVVLLPRGASMLREGSLHLLRQHVARLVVVVLAAASVGVLAIELVADSLTVTYLGPDFAAAAGPLRAIAWATIPWAAFVTLRALLDASEARALNARNLTVAAAAYAVLVAFGWTTGADRTWDQLSFVAAAALLGALTLWEAWRAFPVSRPLELRPDLP